MQQTMDLENVNISSVIHIFKEAKTVIENGTVEDEMLFTKYGDTYYIDVWDKDITFILSAFPEMRICKPRECLPICKDISYISCEDVMRYFFKIDKFVQIMEELQEKASENSHKISNMLYEIQEINRNTIAETNDAIEKLRKI